MKRFSVAVSDDMLDEIEKLRVELPKVFHGHWAKPWSRDYTASWLLGRALLVPEVIKLRGKLIQPDLLEQVNQTVDGGVQSGDGISPG